MAFRALKKGSGYLYEHDKHLYKRVKTEGETKYLKCVVVGCDGSAKLVRDQFFVGVSVMCMCLVSAMKTNLLLRGAGIL